MENLPSLNFKSFLRVSSSQCVVPGSAVPASSKEPIRKADFETYFAPMKFDLEGQSPADSRVSTSSPGVSAAYSSLRFNTLG